MATYDELMTAIVKKQMSVRGKESALHEARSVPGIQVDDNGNVSGGSKAKLKSLVNVYKDITGTIAVTFAKRAKAPLLTGKEDLPEELKG